MCELLVQRKRCELTARTSRRMVLSSSRAARDRPAAPRPSRPPRSPRRGCRRRLQSLADRDLRPVQLAHDHRQRLRRRPIPCTIPQATFPQSLSTTTTWKATNSLPTTPSRAWRASADSMAAALRYPPQHRLLRGHASCMAESSGATYGLARQRATLGRTAKWAQAHRAPSPAAAATAKGLQKCGHTGSKIWQSGLAAD
jgi:hypothetical protein